MGHILQHKLVLVELIIDGSKPQYFCWHYEWLLKLLCCCCIYIWLFFTTLDTRYMFLGFHSNYIQKQSLQKYNQQARSLLIELLFLLWEEEGLAAWPADIGGIVFVKINLPGYKPVMDHTTAISKLLYLSKTQMIKGSFIFLCYNSQTYICRVIKV